MKKTFISVTLLLLACSCRKEYSYPPLKEVNDGAQISIKQLKERLTSSSSYRFKGGDTNLYCTVTSDEISGNFYEQIFVRDNLGGAIQVNIKESGGLYVGDKLRINLNNIYLVSANSMIYLDSVDVGKSIVKLSSGNEVLPKIVSVSDIATNSNNFQSQLVQINNVEFKKNTAMPTFADAIGKTSVNQTITTCETGQALTVRTSGRSNFAGKLLPGGNGSIIGIISQYNSTMQLTVRDFNEVKMSGPLCGSSTNTQVAATLLYKNFNDNSITSGGWASYCVNNNSVNWTVSSSSTTSNPYARISGFIGGVNTNSENWLISPVVNTANAKSPVLSFQTAAKFSGTALDVLVSNNSVNGSPSSGTWISLSPNFTLSPAPSSGGYVWTSSGSIPLGTFKSATLRVAFKYKSTTSGATTYELDDIFIKEGS
jgi:hypothetical protein